MPRRLQFLRRAGVMPGDGGVKTWLFHLALQNLKILWRQKWVLVALFVTGYAVSTLVLLLVAGRVTYESLDVVERLGFDPRTALTITLLERPAAEEPFGWAEAVEVLLQRPDFMGLDVRVQASALEELQRFDVRLQGRTFQGERPWFHDVAAGRTLEAVDVSGGARVAVVGKAAMERLEYEAEPGTSLTILGETWDVIGVYAPDARDPLRDPVQQVIDVPLGALMPLVQGTEIRRVDMRLYVREPIPEEELEEEIAAPILGVLGDHHIGVDGLERLYDGLGAALRANAAGFMTAGAVALLAVVNVASLLRYWIKRRQHEISIRLASGASNREVSAMLFYEQLVLMGFAMLLGGAIFIGLVPLMAAGGIALYTGIENAATVAGALLILLVAINALINRATGRHSLVTSLRGANP